MRKKQRGFTLVELLAVMVILGIIMAVALPNVTGILSKNRANTYVEDAKKLATVAEYKLRGSTSGVVKPAVGDCVIMNLAYLDNSEFEEPPNGGEYMKDESYVVITKKATASSSYEFVYYVQLLEEIDPGTVPRGIPLTLSTELSKEGATSLVANVDDDSQVFKWSPYNYKSGTDQTVIDYNNAIETKILSTTEEPDLPSAVTCTNITHIYASE